ncbi:MAG: hypothetical protein KDA28_01490, partial [Phycisphaerales bacterium]|nr:hypothetical protein [Phycisphaerales bacterium]
FDPKRGVFPNDEGQVLDGGVPVDDLFVVGWAKRGPTGLIGTNRQDSVATVNKMLATGVKHPAKGPDPKEWLDAKVPKHVNWEDWLKLDAAERARGAEKGKVRDKFTVVPEMLKHVDKH